jgi:hypothetical protein
MMTDREQVLRLRRQNRDLAVESARLRLRLCDMQREYQELEEANRELRVELQAADYVVGESMEAALEAQRR